MILLSNKKFYRRKIREKAIQTLFQLSMNDTLTLEQAIEFSINLDDKNDEDTSLVMTDVPYLQTIIFDIVAKQEGIDEMIKKHLQKWSISRISKINLAILRLATYELAFVPNNEVPGKVAINEALELSKLYSDEQSTKFINGILSNVLKDIES